MAIYHNDSGAGMYIWWLLLYGFIYSVSGTLARRLDQPYIFFALFISAYWVILLHFLFRRKRCRIYGICLPEEDAACGKLILAALSFAAANLMLYGCSGQWSVGWHSLPLTTLAGECVLTVMAVWGEEVFFRGVLPEKLSEHLGRTAAGWISVLLSLLTFIVKIALMLFFMIWVRWTLPRFRYDQVMRIGWKITLPIAIANLVFYMCLSSI